MSERRTTLKMKRTRWALSREKKTRHFPTRRRQAPFWALSFLMSPWGGSSMRRLIAAKISALTSGSKSAMSLPARLAYSTDQLGKSVPLFHLLVRDGLATSDLFACLLYGFQQTFRIVFVVILCFVESFLYTIGVRS